MNTHPLALPISVPLPPAVERKRVLLVDTSHAKRELRAEVMRSRGMDVDCAADIAEARSWWRAALYDLVLINMEKGGGQRDSFCNDLRGAKPPQRLAFLVGQPEYLTDSPSADQELLMKQEDEAAIVVNSNVDFTVTPADANRYSILDASRRISAVRAASVARTNAKRALPPPPRDLDTRPSKPSPAGLNDILREER